MGEGTIPFRHEGETAETWYRIDGELRPDGPAPLVTLRDENGQEKSARLVGGILEKEVTFPRGHARNPMTDAEVETKFRSLAEPLLAPSTIAEILDRCWNLERQTDIGELLALFEIKGAG